MEEKSLIKLPVKIKSLNRCIPIRCESCRHIAEWQSQGNLNTQQHKDNILAHWPSSFFSFDRIHIFVPNLSSSFLCSTVNDNGVTTWPKLCHLLQQLDKISSVGNNPSRNAHLFQLQGTCFVLHNFLLFSQQSVHCAQDKFENFPSCKMLEHRLFRCEKLPNIWISIYWVRPL